MKDVRYMLLRTTPVGEVDSPIGPKAGWAGGPAVYVLVGAPGAEKSAVCEELEKQGITVLSLDGARGEVGRPSGDQAATPGALVGVVEQMISALRRGRAVGLDATSSTPKERAVWLGIARAHRVPAIAVVFRTELDVWKIDAVWEAVTAISDEALDREGFTAVHNVRGGSWMPSGEPESKARRGDLAVIATTTRSTSIRDFFVGESRTEYEITEVTSVTQAGQVKAVRRVSCEAPVPLRRWHGLTEIWIVPRDRVDTAAVLAAARAHTWPGHPNQPKAFDSLAAVQDVMRANRSQPATGGGMAVPAPVQATPGSRADEGTS